jgi:serine/threonine protein kinase
MAVDWYYKLKGLPRPSLPGALKRIDSISNDPGVVTSLGQHEYGLRFQFEANGAIRRYFSRTDFKIIPFQERKKWVQQAAESVAFIHSKDVIHCDCRVIW